MSKHATYSKDFFTATKELTSAMIDFEHKGDLKHSKITIEELQKYSKENDLQCVHGADTSINFQYSFVVTLTDNVKHYTKACKQKEEGKAKGEGKVLSTIEADLNAVSRLYTLASYGFKVTQKDSKHFAIISPRYQKLESIRRIMDYNELFFNFEYIACSRYDGNELMDNVKVNHADIIQEAQRTNRHFSYKWISNRAPKEWN
ncbi:MAG: hypothetical protein II013_07855 [Lachnobacterium sp.]|nr:hypothetical protein [Lachnobacterium sp.]